ncbi:MAG: M20/M25/M40 family metallo-hydrolase [Candidatus Sulfomarinibacteraceae bacterium]
MDLRQRLGLLVLGFVVIGPSSASAGEPAQLAELVTVEGLRRHVMVLGSDGLEGRAAGSRGGNRAAAYIADELERIGVSPAGDNGSYLQQVPLQGSRPRPDSRLMVSSLGEKKLLELGRDYLLVTTGEQTLLPRATPVVFVGYGIVAPEFDYNDYADVDVRGKVAVFIDGEPSSGDPGYFRGDEPSVYSAIETKQRTALSRGAVASVLIPPTGAGETWWAGRERSYAFEHITAAAGVPRHLSLILHPSVVPTLFSEALFDFTAIVEMDRTHTMRSFHLPVQLSFTGDFDTRSFLAPNVVGVIEGADPRLRDTFVVVTAHYDHLGIGPEVDGDSIYNGVVDNALGVAGGLEIARAFMSLGRAPRRSLLFLFSTAEEEGNLGSTYFLDHTAVPLPDLVANVNIDGLAFLESFDDVVGIGGELSDLGRILDETADALGLAVTPTTEIMWSHAAFARSDQAAFAEAGVPSILISEGFRWPGTPFAEAVHRMWLWFETRYHTPFDDLDQPLDLDASRRHCGVTLAFIWAVADRRTAPQWKPGSSFAYQRLLSMAEHRD